MTLLPLSVAFLIGLVSTLHCISMCGGIMGALIMGLPPERRQSARALFPYAFAYNLGRILSYTLAGALLAVIGGSLFGVLPTGQTGQGHALLRIFAGLLMLGVGLYLAGWFPSFISIEKVGLPIWKRLQPIGQRFMPVNTLGRAFLFGVVWGWLPCGLVYSVLFTAAAQGTALGGGAYMLAFGLGTLPAVVLTGVAIGRIGGRNPDFHQSTLVRQGGGMVIIVLATITLIWPGIGAPDMIQTLCAIPQND